MILALALVMMTSVSMFGVNSHKPNIKKDGRPDICHMDKHGKGKPHCKECKKAKRDRKRGCDCCKCGKKDFRMKIDRKGARKNCADKPVVVSGRR